MSCWRDNLIDVVFLVPAKTALELNARLVR